MYCLQRLRAPLLIKHKAFAVNIDQKNNFWGWLTFVFNRVSKSRVDQVGPDRACAEWLMRNGAFIRWRGQNQLVSHYNQLPTDDDKSLYYIQEVDATNASISHHGFAHFKHCKYIERIKFDRCDYLEDKALFQLDLLKHSLESLFIYRCGNLTDRGIITIAKLIKLRTLELDDLVQVDNIKKCIKEIQGALPDCKISYTISK